MHVPSAYQQSIPKIRVKVMRYWRKTLCLPVAGGLAKVITVKKSPSLSLSLSLLLYNLSYYPLQQKKLDFRSRV